MKRKSILITGSSKGLGESLALVFSQNNYDIILHGRNEKNLTKIKNKILENNVECQVVRGDINSNRTIYDLVKNPTEETWDTNTTFWDLNGNVYTTVWDSLDNTWADASNNTTTWAEQSGSTVTWSDASPTTSTWKTKNPTQTLWESGTFWDLNGNTYTTLWDTLDNVWTEDTGNTTTWTDA